MAIVTWCDRVKKNAGKWECLEGPRESIRTKSDGRVDCRFPEMVIATFSCVAAEACKFKGKLSLRNHQPLRIHVAG